MWTTFKLLLPFTILLRTQCALAQSADADIVEADFPDDNTPDLGQFQSGVCRDFSRSCKSDPFLCIVPEYYQQCRRTCGCLDKCKDNLPDCFSFPDLCFLRSGKTECQRICGHCDGCKDLLQDELCGELKDFCFNERVQYFCSATCGKCSAPCRDKLSPSSVCRLYASFGFCESGSVYSRDMSVICAKSCGTCRNG